MAQRLCFQRGGGPRVEDAEDAAFEEDARREQTAYENALRNLGWYLRLRPDRVDVLEQYAVLAADCVHDSRSFDRAFNSLEAVVRQESDREKVRRRLIDLAMMAGRYQDAKVHLEFLLKQSPADPELLTLYGRCQAELGDPRLAAESFKKAIESGRDQVEAYALLAGVLRYRLTRAKRATSGWRSW